MKNKITINLARYLLAFLFIFSFSGCGEYLQNPLIDKETGDDINLLLVDFNFFKTRITYKIKDASNGSLITSDATVKFYGKNANDIVTFSGEKKPEFFTNEGLLELTVDPNVVITENSPLQFSVTVNINGYNELVKGIQIKSEGLKSYELFLSKVVNEEETDLTGDIEFEGNDTIFNFFASQTGFKSAQVEEKSCEVKYSVTITDLKKFTDINNQLLFSSSTEIMNAYYSDPENFIISTVSTFSEYEPEIDVANLNGSIRNVLFHKLETGKMKKLVIAGKEVGSLNGGFINSTCNFIGDVLPDFFGFAEFNEEYWNFMGDKVKYDNLNFSYTVASASGEMLCDQGCSITFQSDIISSFSFDADVFDTNNNYITSLNFTGNFPNTFIVENIPEKAVKLVFRNNNPSFKELSPLAIANFCNGSYEVNVSKVEGYVEYQIVMKAICRNNPTVAIAPTYSVEIRLKNSDQPWQGVHMEGGVVDLMGIPDSDYEIRLLWENEWEYSTYSTRFDEDGNYLGKPEEDAKVKSKMLEDGRIQISIEKIFNQDICDELGW